MKYFMVFLVITFLFGALEIEAAEPNPADSRKADGTELQAKSEPNAKDKEIAENLVEARRALEFGIDSTVLSVINQASSTKDARLSIEIEKQFNSLNPDVQKAAIEHFTILGNFSVHVRVFGMLANFNDYQAPVVVALLRFLKEEKQAATTEQKVLLLEISEASKAEIQSAAIETLGIVGTLSEIDPLIKIFKKSSTPNSVRASVLKVLGQLINPTSYEFLKQIVEDKAEEKTLRYEAITSLGRHGQVSSLKAVAQSLMANDIFERGAAISALSGFDPTTVIPQYSQALRDSYWRNRVAVVKVISEKKLRAMEEAIQYLAEKDPERPVQLEAIRALSVLDTASGWNFLTKQFLNEKTPVESRAIIAELMASKHLGASIDPLKTVMAKEWDLDKSWLLNAICRELTNAKNPAAAMLYEKMLDHKDYMIRMCGVRGIKDAGLIGLRPRLEAMMKSNPPAALKASLEDALK